MDIIAAIAERRSTRDFTAQTVDDETIRRLIDAAVLAPSASNGQPWTFTVVRDQALLDRISAAAKSHLLRPCRPVPSTTVAGRVSPTRVSSSSTTPRH